MHKSGQACAQLELEELLENREDPTIGWQGLGGVGNH